MEKLTCRQYLVAHLRISRVFTFTPSRYLYGIVFKYRNSFAWEYDRSNWNCTLAAVPRTTCK